MNGPGSLKRSFTATITLLSPLHIGSGRELQRDFDYVTRNGKTWVIDAPALLERVVDANGRLREDLLGAPASQLLDDADYADENSPVFRYVLKGEPRSREHGAVVREMYKDAFDRPYIPGSSLKGSLRTILAWHGFTQRNLRLDVGRLGQSRSWAGQPIERALFGQNPNSDLLRGLLVADSEPQAPATLHLANAQVVMGSDRFGSPVEVEAVWTNTVFKTRLTLDAYLSSPAVAQQLGFGANRQWLTGLPAIARDWAADYLKREREWFRSRGHVRVDQLYTQMLSILAANKLGANQFFANLGWGGGWSVKTIGEPLKADKKQWEALLSDRNLKPARIRRREGDDFPKSRRAYVSGNKVVAPFGWCLVELNEEKQA